MKAIVIGATGLVGQEIIKQLDANKSITEIIALVRKPGMLNLPKLQYQLFNFEIADASLITGDILFCAMGTTLKTAGSKEAQYKIDCTYPTNIVEIAKNNNIKTVALVSSLGATKNTSNFYLKTKGELEENILKLNFYKTIIARPSLLLGKRKEFRLGENIGAIFMSTLSFLFVGPLKKWKAIEAKKVANALITNSIEKNNGIHILENDVLQSY